ncbi:hypothetical protein CSPX01_09187 [Colletotrichum filicis]|nr:hypothetical protein CSPX01_09187 [Colletotrichum filicis]
MGQKERLEVDNYHHGDEEASGFDLETLEEENGFDHSVGLAEAIASMTEKQLGIDVLDQGKDISTFLSYLLDTIQIMENHAQYRDAKSSSSGSGSDSGSDSQDEAVINQPVPFQVVHRVFCTETQHSCHGTDLYEDEPVKRSFKYSPALLMLQGEKKIFNLDTWLSKRSSLCFVIIKEHLCYQYQRPSDRKYGLYNARLPSDRLERLKIVSPLLQKALKQVAKFQIYPKYRHEDFVAEMEAPYSFLFHHRKQLAEITGTGAFQEVVSHLMRFLEEHYEAEYREAEEMFLQGCVNAHHIHKLFKPNQMLLSSKKGEPKFAFILGRYSRPKREEILLHGWKWQYDGHDLQRAPALARISLVPEEKTRC